MQQISFHITDQFDKPALVISHDGMIVEILDLEDEIDLSDPEAWRDLGKAVVQYLRPEVLPADQSTLAP